MNVTKKQEGYQPTQQQQGVFKQYSVEAQKGINKLLRPNPETINEKKRDLLREAQSIAQRIINSESSNKTAKLVLTKACQIDESDMYRLIKGLIEVLTFSTESKNLDKDYSALIIMLVNLNSFSKNLHENLKGHYLAFYCNREDKVTQATKEAITSRMKELGQLREQGITRLGLALLLLTLTVTMIALKRMI